MGPKEVTEPGPGISSSVTLAFCGAMQCHIMLFYVYVYVHVYVHVQIRVNVYAYAYAYVMLRDVTSRPLVFAFAPAGQSSTVARIWTEARARTHIHARSVTKSWDAA